MMRRYVCPLLVWFSMRRCIFYIFGLVWFRMRRCMCRLLVWLSMSRSSFYVWVGISIVGSLLCVCWLTLVCVWHGFVESV